MLNTLPYHTHRKFTDPLIPLKLMIWYDWWQLTFSITIFRTDKLVFKVNKATSNTMLSLVTYGPSYISPNPIIGREEAKKFFPEGYISADLEQIEIPEEKTKPTKLKQTTKAQVKRNKIKQMKLYKKNVRSFFIRLKRKRRSVSIRLVLPFRNMIMLLVVLMLVR